MFEKQKTTKVFKSDFELKIQKEHSHLKFALTILIHLDSAFIYTPQSQKISISDSYSINTCLWRRL